MKTMKFLAAAIMMVSLALPAAAQDSSQEIVYEEIKIPRYREASHEPVFFYVNNQWIPNCCIVKPEDVKHIEIKPNEYNNTSVYCTVDEDTFVRIKDEVNKVNVDSILSIEPTCMFPGGNWRLHYWLKDNVCLPEGYKGSTRATVGFKVSLNGAVSDAIILKSAGNKELDDEALRVVNSMPKFVVLDVYRPDAPPFYFSLPIDFTSPDVIFLR